MNSEFHCHLTCLIAARAGFPPEDARTVATAIQYMRGLRLEERTKTNRSCQVL